MAATTTNKNYSDLFPSDDDDDDNDSSSSKTLDADVIVVGAGIGGASIAHHLSSNDEKCRVIVLEQYDYTNKSLETKEQQQQEDRCSENSQDTKTDESKFRINYGSSRGGPRRIGLIMPDDKRSKLAWDEWNKLNLASSSRERLMDIAAEVYVFNLLPFGWMFMMLFGSYFMYKKYICNVKLPKGLQFLWTSNAVENKLSPKQGFSSGCWKGCVGIYYDESAALHTDQILRHMLTTTPNENKNDNLDVRYGTKVIKIEQLNNNDDDVVQVTVQRIGSGTTTKEYTLKCRHFVLACGGWTGDLLKQFLSDNSRNNSESDDYYDPNDIQTKIESFTCPVYQIKTTTPMDKDSVSPQTPPPPPLSIESKCPLFSCVNKKLYGFPVNHHRSNNNNSDEYCYNYNVYIRPFFKASESQDPNDQLTSDEQLQSINDFVTNCLAVDKENIKCEYYYTCRYPKLSLDGGKSYKTVMDFVPFSNQRIAVHAGLDGYSFKFGSIFGMEFMELLETGKILNCNNNCQWPKPKNKDKKSNRRGFGIFGRLFTFLARKEETSSNHQSTTQPTILKKDE